MRKIYLLLAFVLVLLLSSCQTKTFEVNFYADDVLLKSEEVETNKSATAPDAPDKEGYTFIKWDQDFSKVSKDLKVNAVYEIKKYQVKFFVDDNQIGEVQYVNHGEAAVAPDVVIIKPGYKHIGWDKDGKNIQASIDIFAKFEEVTDRYT
ncbi:MAG: lipoprotein [Acholeplasmataceae bacterium]|nr:lipoprotein [Acholeplasmataceae bacterium]